MEADETRQLRDALVRLVIDWSSSGTQSAIMRAADVEIDVPDVSALYMLGMEGERRLSALAALLRQSAPTTSKQVVRLRRRGLISGRRDPVDSRATLLSVTSDGLAVIEAMHAVTDRRILEAMTRAQLPPDLHAAFRRFAAELVGPVGGDGPTPTNRPDTA